MKIRINREVLESLNPDRDGPNYEHFLYRALQDWRICKEHSAQVDFNGDIVDFLKLEGLRHAEKIWVSAKLLPAFLIEVFMIDCAMSAYISAADYENDENNIATAFDSDAAYRARSEARLASRILSNNIACQACDTSSSAIDAAGWASYAKQESDNIARKCVLDERQRQIESLIYLITNN